MRRRTSCWLALTLLAIVAWPIYWALSQNTAASSEVPTRLVQNRDGTVSVWFQGTPDAAYQIDYCDTKAATPQAMAWTRAADGVVATAGWTEWCDTGGVNRPAPTKVSERYYRVIRSTAVPSVQPPPPAPAPPSEELPAPSDALPSAPKAEKRLTRLQELAEIGERVGAVLGGGGAAAHESLAAKLATTSLSVADLIHIGMREHHAMRCEVANAFYEAVLGPRAAEASDEERAGAHNLLGECRWVQGSPEDALAHFEQADRLLAGKPWRSWTKLAQMYCLLPLGRYDEVRERFAELESLPPQEMSQQFKEQFREYSLWMVSQSYCKQKRCAESVAALEEMSQSQASEYQMVAEVQLRFCRKHAQEQGAERERQEE